MSEREKENLERTGFHPMMRLQRPTQSSHALICRLYIYIYVIFLFLGPYSMSFLSITLLYSNLKTKKEKKRKDFGGIEYGGGCIMYNIWRESNIEGGNE